jgi:hypothetical protein
MWVIHGFFAGFCGLLRAFAGFADFFAGSSRVCRVLVAGSNHDYGFLDTSS